MTPIIRQIGSIIQGGSKDQYFIVQELKIGINQSREYLYFVGSVGRLEIYDRDARKGMKKALAANHARILDAWIFAIEKAAKENDSEAIKSLSLLATQTHHWLWFEWAMIERRCREMA